MNAFSPIAVPDTGLSAQACSAPFAWRGLVLNSLAKAELAVTETLIIMRQHPLGLGIDLPLLVGARLAALQKAIAADGPFATHGSAARAALEDFLIHSDLRAVLSHGVADVLRSNLGRWCLHLKMIRTSSNTAQVREEWIDQAKAEELRRKVQGLSDRLIRKLQTVNEAVLNT